MGRRRCRRQKVNPFFLAEAKKKQNCEHNKPFFDLRSAYF